MAIDSMSPVYEGNLVFYGMNPFIWPDLVFIVTTFTVNGIDIEWLL